MPNKHPHGSLRWNAPGKVPSVQLDFGVIERMTVEVMRGFGVTRRRGTELGGILLGKIDTAGDPVVFIYDYETVPCEYSEGPSYVLSARDRELFSDVVARWSPSISPDQYVVGYFRSHTRDGLQPDDIDARQFHWYIDNPLAVALLVKPYATRASEAGFFLQSAGRLDTKPTALQFQFTPAEEAIPRSAASSAPAAPPRPVATDHFAPAVQEPELGHPEVDELPVEEPAKTPNRPERQVLLPERERYAPAGAPPLFSTYYPEVVPTWKTRALWVAFSLAVFGFGTVVGYQYAGGQVHFRAESAAEQLPAPVADPYTVNLSANAQDRSVLVKWDRDSGPIKAAQRGVLTITEGTASKEVKLDAAELRNGTVLYHKVGQEVSFRLELFFKGSLVMTETVTLRLGTPPRIRG